MADGDWYYCLDHHTVEPYDGCKSATRLGPYATAADAGAALQRVEQRNEQWENDPRYKDDDDDDERRGEERSNPFS